MGRIVDRRKTITAAGWSLPALVTTLAVPAARASSTTSGTNSPWTVRLADSMAGVTALGRGDQVCFHAEPTDPTGPTSVLPPETLTVVSGSDWDAQGITVTMLDGSPLQPVSVSSAGDHCFTVDQNSCSTESGVSIGATLGNTTVYWNGIVDGNMRC